MTRKRIAIFSFATLFCIVAAYLAYQKFEKYLPTPANVLAFPPELSDAQIQKIRTETPIDSIQVHKAERYLKLKHQIGHSALPDASGFSTVGQKFKKVMARARGIINRWRNPQSTFYKSCISLTQCGGKQKLKI